MARRTREQWAEAARRGWVTRRANARRRAIERERRAEAARRGWATRRQREGEPRGPRVKLKTVYDEMNVAQGAALGYAWSLADAEAVAANAKPDDEVVDVYRSDAPAWDRPTYVRSFYVRYRVSDDMPSDEWEIGFSYRGADAGSNVDVNIRIAREDGAAFGVHEATRVLRDFQKRLSTDSNDPIPPGYRMAFIDWQRPRWGTQWQSGDESDLTSFYAPMYVETSNPAVWSIEPTGNMRLGSVKP